MKDSIDVVITESLTEFVGFICHESWRGREREAISLYVMGYLIPRIMRCAPGSPLFDPSQIAIEGAVAQVADKGKKHVCKDLVIWPGPATTYWWAASGGTKNTPVAIMEWKVGQPKPSSRDIDWLRRFSEGRKTLVGFAVNLMLLDENSHLSCSRIAEGSVDSNWLVIPDGRTSAVSTR